jgi:hypothetical protein
MASDPTGLAIDTVLVSSHPVTNDAGERAEPVLIPFPARVTYKIIVAYTSTGELTNSTAQAVVFTDVESDIEADSTVITPDGVEQEVLSISPVRDELGRHHHHRLMFA